MSTSAIPSISILSFFFTVENVIGARTELVNAEDEDGLVDLKAEDLGLDERERLAVDLDQTFTSLFEKHQYRCFVGSIMRRELRVWYVPCSARRLYGAVSLSISKHGFFKSG
jgi:hypothetical protein